MLYFGQVLELPRDFTFSCTRKKGRKLRKINMFIHYATVVAWVFCTSVYSYEIPEPSIERLNPRGIRVYIPDEPGVRLFAFHANVNDPIEENETGTIAGEVTRSRDNRWSFEDKNLEIRANDVLHYWIYVQANGLSYTRIGQERNTTNDMLGNKEMPGCEKSVTAIRGKIAECRDRLIFEETFDEEIDGRETTATGNSSWKRVIMLPLDPDYEFCVYRELPNSLRFENGIMSIVPLLLDETYGENVTLFGQLDLSESCTGSVPLECKRRAVGHSILPPAISARLTTRESFYFRYGKIEIRAKFPKGDWLYPELWLEPKRRNYGFGYSSGRVILGLVRGNEYLTKTSNSGDVQFGSTFLEFGLRTGPREKVREDKITKPRSLGAWNDDFHVYATIWNEEGFRFLVDGEEVGRIQPGGWLNYDQSGSNSTRTSNNMAPYDNEFFITVGLGIGGIRIFPDATMSGRNAKPWRNVEAKAMLNFWRAKKNWLSSWPGRNRIEDSNFQLDYIRIWTV